MSAAEKVAPPQSLLERCDWRKAEAPKLWRPNPGDNLVGYFAGKSVRNGSFGQYEVALVRVESGKIVSVSGVKVIQIVDSAQIEPETPIRIWYHGTQSTGNGHNMKQYEVFVGVERDHASRHCTDCGSTLVGFDGEYNYCAACGVLR